MESVLFALLDKFSEIIDSLSACDFSCSQALCKIESDEDQSSTKKTRKLISAEAKAVLMSWLTEHSLSPYPTNDEKEELSIKSSLSLKQVEDWLINARRRYLNIKQK